jgi:ABC-type Fe3+/spermidine/putrescine transport system ATPase subunit
MFDEPLGALDRTLREDLLNELRTLLHQTKIPAIYVTHDQEEAFAIADRVLILHEGSIVRDGTPAGVWANPGSVVAAEFLGLGNVMIGEVLAKNRFQTEHGTFTVKCTHNHSRGDTVHLLARPLPARKEANELSGVVADVLFQQDRYRVTLDNALYLYLNDDPGIGKTISVPVKVECLA